MATTFDEEVLRHQRELHKYRGLPKPNTSLRTPPAPTTPPTPNFGSNPTTYVDSAGNAAVGRTPSGIKVATPPTPNAGGEGIMRKSVRTLRDGASAVVDKGKQVASKFKSNPTAQTATGGAQKALSGASNIAKKGFQFGRAQLGAGLAIDQAQRAAQDFSDGNYGQAALHSAASGVAGTDAIRTGRNLLQSGGNAAAKSNTISSALKHATRGASNVATKAGVNAAGKVGLRAVGKALSAPVVATGSALYDNATTNVEDYAKRFGVDAHGPNGEPMGFGKYAGLRALGFASDLGNALTFGLAGNTFKDKQDAGTTVAHKLGVNKLVEQQQKQQAKPEAATQQPQPQKAAATQPAQSLRQAATQQPQQQIANPSRDPSQGTVNVTRDPVTGTPTFSGSNVREGFAYSGNTKRLRGLQGKDGNYSAVSTVPGFFSGGENSAYARGERANQINREIQRMKADGVSAGPSGAGGGGFGSQSSGGGQTLTIGDSGAAQREERNRRVTYDSRVSDIMRQQTTGKITAAQRSAETQRMGQQLAQLQSEMRNDATLRGQDLRNTQSQAQLANQRRGQDLNYQNSQQQLGLQRDRLNSDNYYRDLTRGDTLAQRGFDNQIKASELGLRERGLRQNVRNSAAQTDAIKKQASQKNMREHIMNMNTYTGEDGKAVVNHDNVRKTYDFIHQQAALQERALTKHIEQNPNDQQAMAQLERLRSDPTAVASNADVMNIRQAMRMQELVNKHGTKGKMTGNIADFGIVGVNKGLLENEFVLANGARIPIQHVLDQDANNKWFSGLRVDANNATFDNMMTPEVRQWVMENYGG